MKIKSPSDSLFASPRASRHLRRAAIATASFFALASIGCDSSSTENVDQASKRTASGVTANGDIALSRTDALRNPRDADARDRAADDFGRALRANGYEIEHANTRHIQHALYAENLGMEVVLTFFPHDEQTRVEILFLGGALVVAEELNC